MTSDFVLHSGVVVSTVPSQKEGSQVESRLGSFFVEFQCSHVPAWDLCWYSDFLPQSKNMHVRLIGGSELTQIVSISGMYVCVSVWSCDGLVTCPGQAPPVCHMMDLKNMQKQRL